MHKRNDPYCNCIKLYEQTHNKKYTGKRIDGATLHYMKTELSSDGETCIHCGYYVSFGDPSVLMEKLSLSGAPVKSSKTADVDEKDLNETFYGFYF